MREETSSCSAEENRSDFYTPRASDRLPEGAYSGMTAVVGRHMGSICTGEQHETQRYCHSVCKRRTLESSVAAGMWGIESEVRVRVRFGC